MKKLMTMLAAAAMAFGLYAADTGFLSGAGFDPVQTEDPANGFYTWKNISDVGTFTTGYWSASVEDFVTVTDGVHTCDCEYGKPLQFADEGPYDTQYANIKTTLGQPVSMRVKASPSSQMIGTGLYFDTLIKPTVFDEIPNMAAYDEEEGAKAKVGVFVYQSDETDETTKKLYVYAGATATSATNFYMTSQTIDDTKWYRLTIKMIANINKAGATAQPGYVVFINGAPVEGDLAKIVDETNLTPEAKEWNRTGSLFLGLTTSTTVSEVLVDGQGSIDSVAFTTKAPTFAEDTEFCQITGATNIKSFTVGSQTWNAGDAALDVEVIDSIAVTNIKADDEYFCPYTTTNITDAVKGQTYEVGEAKKLGATVEIGGEKMYFETAAAALAELNDTSKYAAATTAELTLNAAESGAITLNNANITLTLDLAGKTMAATNPEADAVVWVAAGTLTIINSTDEVGTVDGTSCYAAVDMDENGTAYITAGQFKGDVYTVEKGITGGWFTEEFEDDSIIADGYAPKALPEEADPFKWEVVEATSVDFTVTAGENSKVAQVLVNGADVTADIPTELEVGDTYKVTFEANSGYMFAAGAQYVFEGTAADEAIDITGPNAALVVATVTDADGAAMGNYATLTEALTAATNLCTVTLQQDATLGKTSLSKSITLDLNSKTLTGAVGASDKYLISLNLGYELTVKNGSIVAKTDATQAAFSEIFHVYADLTVENVAIDAAGLTGTGYFDTGTAAVFAVMNGNVQITGSTSVANVNKGYLLSVGNHAGAGKGYDSRNVTINTTGTLDGDFFFAGGNVTYTAGDITGAKFYYGASRADTNRTDIAVVTTEFAISDLTGFNLTTGVGEVPTAPTEAEFKDKKYYALNGQLYATVADAEAVGQDKIVLFTDYALAADKAFNNAVAVVAPAKITLGIYKLTAPNGDLADAAFEIPTGKKVEKTDNTGSFTYALVDDAQPVPPGEFEPIPCDDEIEAAIQVAVINGNKAKYIAAPAGIDAEKYRTLFEAKAVSGEPGVSLYKVVIDLTADAKKDLQDQVNDDVAAAIADITAPEATITTTPGLYYAIVGGKEVGTIATEGAEQMATGNSLTLTKPELGETTKAFYKVRVSISAKK